MKAANGVIDIYKSQERWRFIDEPISDDPLASLKRDLELLKEVSIGKRGATARLWENPQCLVVTRKETRFPLFEKAKRQLAAEGWPVITRDSGGTAVPHGSGILNFTLLIPAFEGQRLDLDVLYMALCEPVRMALYRLGLTAEYGETKGSYCDGRYNLNVGGLKVTGTAQKIMISPPNSKGVRQAVLAQAMLMVDTDAAEGTYWVNRFYELSGGNRQFDPSVSTSIRALVSGREVWSDLSAQMRSLIRSAFDELIQ